MKTSFLVTTIFYLMTTTLTVAQESDFLAFNDPTGRQGAMPKVAAKTMKRNSTYINKVAVGKNSFASPLQQRLANLKLENLKEYNGMESSKYQVVLADKSSNIHARYDANGIIISTVERHKNAKIPAEIQRKIDSLFPKWDVTENLLIVKYVKGKKAVKRFKIYLTKGKERKNIQFLY